MMQRFPLLYRNVGNASKLVKSPGIHVCKSLDWITAPACSPGLRREEGRDRVRCVPGFGSSGSQVK